MSNTAVMAGRRRARKDAEAPIINPLETLQALALLAGWAITQTADGYIVGRWGMSKSLPDLPAVEAFISRATGVKP